MSANPIRGETTVTIGDVEVVLVADMERLIRLSESTGRPTFDDLFRRLAGGEPDTVTKALRCFTVRGRRKTDGPLAPELDYQRTLEAINQSLDLGALLRLGEPMTQLLSSLIKPVESGGGPLGNATGAQSG